MRSRLRVRMLSSTRQLCRSSGRKGLSSLPGPERCGGCCPKSSPVRPPRTATPSLTRSGAVAEDLRSPGAATMPVLRDLMNTRVAATPADTSVAAAAAGMAAANVGSAVVMQGSFLVGILTERDVLRAAGSGEDLSATTVSAWMTPEPQSASPETSVEDAAQIMLLNGFRHLPVVAGRPAGGGGGRRGGGGGGGRRPLVRGRPPPPPGGAPPRAAGGAPPAANRRRQRPPR